MCGKEPLIEVAVALEQAALADDYFIERKLYPNVDFYSGLIYKGTSFKSSPFSQPDQFLAMGFPTDFFPVLFAIPRVAGWLAHWKESMEEAAPKIWRPRQVYTGHRTRHWVPMSERVATAENTAMSEERKSVLAMSSHPFNRRYLVSLQSKL